MRAHGCHFLVQCVMLTSNSEVECWIPAKRGLHIGLNPYLVRSWCSLPSLTAGFAQVFRCDRPLKLLSKLSLHGIDTSWFSAYLCIQPHPERLLHWRPGQSSDLHPATQQHRRVSGIISRPFALLHFSNYLSLFAGDATVIQYADDTQIHLQK